MLVDSFHPSLALINIEFRHLIAIVIPIAGIVLAGVITVSAMYFQSQRRRMWHETARLALERGQPLPSFPPEETEPERPLRDSKAIARSDVRAGLILIAVGAGIFLFFIAVGAPAVRFAGAIPGFIGVALMLNGLLEPLWSGKKSAPQDRPPQT